MYLSTLIIVFKSMFENMSTSSTSDRNGRQDENELSATKPFLFEDLEGPSFIVELTIDRTRQECSPPAYKIVARKVDCNKVVTLHTTMVGRLPAECQRVSHSAGKSRKMALRLLAEKLLRLHKNIPSSIVFPYTKDLPNIFLPAELPHDLDQQTQEGCLLWKFYQNTTKRRCSFNIKEDNGTRRKCPYVSGGFQDSIVCVI